MSIKVSTFIWLFISIFLISGEAYCQEWQLVWSDEFDYKGLPDPEKWNYEVGMIRNKESQYYTQGNPDNARVEDGVLIIEAVKEDFKGANYTSASLITNGKKEFLYGKLEVRAKLPTGVGMWPAIWMLGNRRKDVGWPECGEIDIMENVGFDPDTIHANIHTKSYNHVKGTNKGSKIYVEAPYKDFHVYSVEWFEDQLVFYVDGRRYFSFENEKTGNDVWPFDKAHYLILNVAVGGAWGGRYGIDESIFPQQMLIDYVRYYEMK